MIQRVFHRAEHHVLHVECRPPCRGARLALGLLLLALPAGLPVRAAVGPAIEPAIDERLPVGEQIEVTLGRADHPVPGLGAARIFRVSPTQDGPLTVQVGSPDGDVLVGLLGPTGAALAQDDDGGLETDARLVLPDVFPGDELRLLVAFKKVREGRLVLSVRHGVVELPTGPELVLQRGRWRVARGVSRLARGDRKDACADLMEGANLLFSVERYAEVTESLFQAEPLLDAYATPDLRPYARAFLACSLFRLGRLQEAAPRLEALVTEARSAGLKPVEMMSVSDLGRLQSALGELEPAGESMLRALDLSRQLGDRGHEVVLHTQIARLRILQGRLDEAGISCAAAEVLVTDLDVSRWQSEVLATRAKWFMAVGDHRSAEALLEQAVLLPGPPASRANLLGQLADLRLLLNDPRGAAHAYWRAAELAGSLNDSALLARILTGTGRARLELDEPLAARESFAAALETLAQRDLPANRVTCMHLLARSLTLLGQDDEALAASMQALQLAETLGDPRLLADAFAALRDHHYRSGDFARCEELAREHLARLLGFHLPIEAARVRTDLAEVHVATGRLKEAEQEARAALGELAAMGLDREHPALEVTSVLTELALRREDLTAAVERMDRLTDIARHIQQRADDVHTASALRASVALSTVVQLAHDLTALRVRLAANPEALAAAVDEGLRMTGRWKGVELAAGLQGLRRGGGDVELSRLLQERRRLLAERDVIVAKLLEAVTEGRSGTDVEALAGSARTLDDRAQQIATALAEHSPRDAAFENLGSWGLAELRESLRSDEVYVEYVEGRRQLYSFVVSHESAVMHDLGSLIDRRAEVHEFVVGLSQREQLADVATLARTGAAVWNSLLGAAFPGDIPTGTRLVIVPSGSVATLPFEALVLASERNPPGFEDVVFLLDRHEVVYASSGPVFAALQSSRPRATPGRALVLGDPVYDVQEGPTLRGSRDPRRLGFSRLPGTRDEALALAHRLLDATGADDDARRELDKRQADGSADAVLDLSGLRLVLGRDLTPDVLQGDLREFGLIHCAAHGHMDVHDPGLTGLALTPSESDDGFVTTADVLELSLDADLAVLSACETARGRERRGEGTLSLSRAFLYAGARSVVSSMWQVDDRETERTMQVFYEGILRDGQTVSASLRQARLAIRHGRAAPDAYRGLGRGTSLGGSPRRKRAAQTGRADLAGHPYFWAPFVYMGPTGLRLLDRKASGSSK